MSKSSPRAPPTTSSGDGRLVVKLVTYKGAWVSRVEGAADDSKVYFVRKSSMRDKGQFGELREGGLVSIKLKRMAGREIVADAVPA